MADLVRNHISFKGPGDDTHAGLMELLCWSGPLVTAERLLCAGEVVSRLTGLLKAHNALTQFLACRCLTDLAAAGPSTSSHSSEARS